MLKFTVYNILFWVQFLILASAGPNKGCLVFEPVGSSFFVLFPLCHLFVGGAVVFPTVFCGLLKPAC